MEHLPPWLRNLPLPKPPASRGSQTAAGPSAIAAPPADAVSDTPNWLRDLQSEVDTTDASTAADQADWLTGETDADVGQAVSGQPDWLTDLANEAGVSSEGYAADETVESDVPDWLRSVDSEPADARVDARTAPPQPFGATSWLNSLGDTSASEEDTPEETAAQPEDAAAEPVIEQPTTSSGVRIPVGATDWLRSIGHEPEQTDTDAPPEEPADSSNDADSGIPDWLRDVSSEDIAQDIEAAAVDPALPVFDPNAPNWLTDSDAVQPPSTQASSPPSNDGWLTRDEPQPQAEPDDDDDANIPFWLRGATGQLSLPESDQQIDTPDWLRDPEPEPAASASTDADEGDVPAWLRDSADEPAVSVSTDAGDGDVPAWLRDPEPEPAVTVDTDEGDVPAWLRDSADEPAVTVDIDAGDVPAWLRDSADEPAVTVDTDEGDVPAWLRDSADEPAVTVDTDEGDVPAWLRDSADEPPASASTDADEGDVPAWLRDSADEPAVSANTDADDDDVPAWLQTPELPQHDALSAVDDGLQVPVAPRPMPNDDVPTWLQEPNETPSVAPAEVGNVPSWLQSPESPALPQPTQPTQDNGEDVPRWLSGDDDDADVDTSTADLPAWLRGAENDAPPLVPAAPAHNQRGLAGQSETPLPIEHPGAAATGAGAKRGFFTGDELPQWLQVPEPEPPAITADAQQLDWLARLGSTEPDDDDAGYETAVATAPPMVLPTRPEYTHSPEQLAAVSLLQQLVRTTYPQQVAVPAELEPTRWQRIGVDRVLYALLALALLVGLLVPSFTSFFATSSVATPEVTDLRAVVGSLTSDDIVLLAYEWDAQRSSELRPLEQAVTKQLTELQTRMVLVSTDPQGTLLSFDLSDTLQAAGYNPTEKGVNFGGRDYVLLGYRPGGELALRSMAQDFRALLRSDFEGRDATQGALATNFDGTPRLETLNDLSLIVVMADQQQDVQVWMEQIHSSAPQVPIAFLMPAEVEPLARPYLRTDGVYYLTGERDALAYEAADTSDAAVRSAAQQTNGQQNYSVIAFVLLLLIGGVIAVASQPRRQDKTPHD